MRVGEDDKNKMRGVRGVGRHTIKGIAITSTYMITKNIPRHTHIR